MSGVSTAKGLHPLLVKYLAQLSTHPLRTKAITTGKAFPVAGADAY